MNETIKSLREKLTPQQLHFVTEYQRCLKQLACGDMTLGDIYMLAYPVCTDRDTASRQGSRLLVKGCQTRNYIDAMMEQIAFKEDKKTVASLEEIREYFTRSVRGYEQLVEELVQTRLYPVINKETGEIVGHSTGLFVDDPEKIPPELLKYFDGFRQVAGCDGFLCSIKMSQADKDRNKCAEMLVKMQGGFIDKVELSGPNGGPIKLEADVKLTIESTCAKLLSEM